MKDLIQHLSTFLTDNPQYVSVFKSIAIAIICFPLLWMLASVVSKIVQRNSTDHVGLLTKKIILYTGSILIVATILVELGFNLSAILGAAGSHRLPLVLPLRPVCPISFRVCFSIGKNPSRSGM